METKNLAKKFLDCVELKVDTVKVVDIVIDDIIEEALNSVVAKTGTLLDDSAKALIWPILEKELKNLAYAKAKLLEDIIKEKINSVKALV